VEHEAASGKEEEDQQYYPVNYADLARLRDRRQWVPAGFDTPRSLAKLGLDHFGPGFGDYRRILVLGFETAVVEASVDRATVSGRLVDTGYAYAGEHREYRLFARDDDPRAVGVGTDSIVFADQHPRFEGSDAVDAVRTIADARAGAVPRYHEVDRGFERVTARTGSPPSGFVWTRNVFQGSHYDGPELESVVASSDSYLFDEGGAYLRYEFVFDRPKSEPLVRRKLRRIASWGDQGPFQGITTVDVTAEQRAASLVMKVPEANYSDAFGTKAKTYPQVTWSFDHERGEDEWTVLITHEAGDEVPAETLQARISPTPPGTESERTVTPDRETVAPGDTLAVPVPDGSRTHADRLQLFWEAPDGSATAILGRYEYAPRSDGTTVDGRREDGRRDSRSIQ